MCVQTKVAKYERSADRQSAETRTHRPDGSQAEITAYPTFIMLSAINSFIMLSAINSSLCIIPVMCCRNVIHFYNKLLFNAREKPASVAQLDARPTGDQEVAGSTPAEVGNILSWRLIMKYFLRSFSPFR